MHLRKALPAVLASFALASGAVTAQASAPSGGSVQLFSPNHKVTMTIHNSGPDRWVEFNPAVYLKARGARFEIDVRRDDYAKPLVATVHLGDQVRRIPTRYLDGWAGLKRAFTMTWSTPGGTQLQRRAVSWCPNDGQASRLSPQAATDTAFIFGCSSHPFTRGQRWGIDRGWARQILGYGINPPANAVGDHLILKVALRKSLAQIFGIPASQRTITFDVRVAHVTDSGGGPVPGPGLRTAARAAVSSGAVSQRSQAPQAPGTMSGRPPADSLPDLIALPAFGIATHSASQKDFLDFAATVYNGGPGALVAEGFRRGSKRVMDAYQMFYRDTKVVGSERVGTMQYDARPTHQHWHFKDFAAYDLVNRHHQRLRTSGKEAFCLAPTDAINLLQPGAVVNPGNGDLGTACGDLSSIWVREVLASGWGDTYTQARAGQSINITTLPNGTYWLRVTANPADRLLETSHANNTALRRVILGGTPGARTVRVPAYGLVDSEAQYGQNPGHPPVD